jgi:Zn ribbon nucleic-acid-binding protein
MEAMSLEQPVAITCPQCDHAQEVIVWSSLNVQVSPDAKDDLLKGEINVFECESCGHKASLVVPFLYHDMALRFCVQFYPPELMDDEETLSLYKPDGTSAADLVGAMPMSEEMRQKTAYMLRPHIIFEMRELLLYILFREKLAAFHQQQ